ncbi:MAG: electron transport complex subunit RsxG [Glaciecola sp.]|nr:electron transport complex subunit RsxG [Glaciecola sp.]
MSETSYHNNKPNIPDLLTNTHRNALILGAFALVTTLLIALTFLGTQDTIAAQQQRMLLRVINDVVPAQYYNNNIQHNCAALKPDPQLGNTADLKAYRGFTIDTNNAPQLNAVAIETVAPDGYSGDIRMIVGIAGNELRTVTGVRVLSHKETPGLGDKIDLRIDDWILSFDEQVFTRDQITNWAVKKDGGQFDAFTGATITPRAVINAVTQALLYVQTHQQEIIKATNQCALGASDE